MMMRKNLMGIFRMFFAASLVIGSFSALNLERLHAAQQSEASSPALQVVNINKASAEELQSVRGIGPSIAERIIAYRNQKGPFKQIEDLANIHGMGKAKLQKIKNQISIA